MSEDKTQVHEGDTKVPSEAEDPANPPEKKEPERTFTQQEVNQILADRMARKDKKIEDEKAETERKAREQALKDQEDWKKLAEERMETVEEKNKRIEELSTLEGERDTANERADLLEARLKGVLKSRVKEIPDDLLRELVEKMPVEEQAKWLEKNAEKLASNGGGSSSSGARPAGSRPTGRSAPAELPRAEADKEAREAQRHARVSNI